MQTYLGLDVGTYSIKAVILRVVSENYYIEDMIEQVIPQFPDRDENMTKIQTLKSILSELSVQLFDSIYASLGANYTVMKRFDLNNVKRGNRQKIIESEFDLLGLFNLDDYAIEYYTIKFDKIFAKILAILIHKPSAKQLINVFDQCKLNIRIIDIDNIVFLNLVRFLPRIENSISRGVELFLDMGHSKTTFTIIENNKIINTRVFNMAGIHLTNLIMDKLSLNYEEAKNVKHNIQTMVTDQNHPNVQNIVSEFITEICNEIKRTIKSINATEFIKIERIFITGGSSNIDGIEQIFKNSLDIEPVKIVLSNEKLKFNSNNIDFNSFSQALGVVFRGDLNQLNSKINIRHGDLALISNYEKIINEVSKYAKLASIFIIVLLGTYFLRYFLFEHRISEMKTQYKNEVVRMFSGEPKELKLISTRKNWDFQIYSSHAIKLAKESKQNKNEILESLSLNNVSAPIHIINKISQSIPKNIYFEIVDFRYQEGILYFEADTNNSKSVETVMEKLKKLKILSQVLKKSEVPKAGSDGKLIHFGVTANISKE